ncbi:cupredoxin domain-containing protein [Paenibacillus oenotherae]|uniref:Cupredoxin domain-containing protein n=2 Tax=Paenibacillus oenotherae TaxID=1435645 RepID=A0ABS7D3E6_9BACL|nr:cupredoxin domain-containing protein [Paenibacillus oenotherae]
MLLLSVIAAFMIIMAACGSNSDSAANGGVEETGAAATSEVVIKASNWKFDQPEYRVKKGEPTKITLQSEEGSHGIASSDIDFKISGNDSKVLTFNNAGEFEIHCNVLCGTGHSQMIAKIIVE